MIDCLYDCFKKWAANGSVYIMSDTHFADEDCKVMAKNWISPDEQLEIINKRVMKNDTLVILGDIGDPEYAKRIKARKILIAGNHDIVNMYQNIFDEVYKGPVFIAPQILLSHEPVDGLAFCVNIHGHDHAGTFKYIDRYGAPHLNVAANVCEYTPINLKEEIKKGMISKIPDIHRITINQATANSIKKKRKSAKCVG